MEKYEIGDLINLFWASFILIYMYPAKTKLVHFVLHKTEKFLIE